MKTGCKIYAKYVSFNISKIISIIHKKNILKGAVGFKNVGYKMWHILQFTFDGYLP